MAQQFAVINAGSSSIKFAVFEDDVDQSLLFRGQVEKIGLAPTLTIEGPAGERLADQRCDQDCSDHAAATKLILKTVIRLLGGERVEGVGHRVVHGGTAFTEPTTISRPVIDELRSLVPLAPLHQPHNLAPIEAIMAEAPGIPQVACFDTAFHRSQSPLAQTFALPREITDLGVRRYGFHGLSYEFVSNHLRTVAPEIANKRIIIAHLGNGASLCAIDNGRSVATTMGFTAVDGLMMGTRCGSVDPGVLLYLIDQQGMDARAVEKLIYQQSGLLGVSGISSDMRTLRESTDARARDAIDLFVYRIIREIGSLTAALGGLDGLVFTGGIGQGDARTRSEVVTGCAWLGAVLDGEANSSGDERIDAASSAIPIWVLPTNEERVIAWHTAALVNGIGAPVRTIGQAIRYS